MEKKETIRKIQDEIIELGKKKDRALGLMCHLFAVSA